MANPKTRKNAGNKGQPKSTQTRRITDFFPVRRSGRVNQSEKKAKQMRDLESKILNDRADNLEVRDFGDKGRGVVATSSFERGDFIVEYAGELIDGELARKRERKYGKDTDIGCYMYYFNFKNKAYCVDATVESGKLGRLVNHSKTAPNALTKVVGIDGKPFLTLVAARDIEPEEEILYDYGDRDKATLAAHPWLRK